jgi:signal transduction histidine kinase
MVGADCGGWRRASFLHNARAMRIVNLRRLLRAACMLLPTLLLAWLLPLGAAAQTLKFQEALSVPGGGQAFPTAPAAHVVPLPDDWSRSRPDHSGTVWYRMAFDAPGESPNQLLGLYIERACSNVEVRLNDRLVHALGRMSEPPTQHCYGPRLVMLPSGLLVAKGNVLDLKVAGHALGQVASRQRAGGLSALELGPYEQLQARHEWRHGLAVSVPQSATAALLLMGTFVLVLARRAPQQTYLKYFGLLLLAWAGLQARLWIADPPAPTPVFECAVVVLLAFITWMAVQYLLHYAGQPRPLLARLLPAQTALVAAAAAVAASQGQLFWVATACYVLLAAEAAVAMVLHLRAMQRSGRQQFWLMAALMGVMLFAVLAELAAQQLTLEPLLFDVTHVMAPLLLLAQSLVLVLEFGRALQDSELNRAELEQRIRDATAQIERNFAQLSELKVEQVTERERKRIAADLHDDLGAKLLTIVHTSDNERISTLAREALEEMRLSVRGLTGKPVRLADALGDWRAEVVSRLNQAGVDGEWSSPNDEDVPQQLSARAYVQTTRILREAVSNVIKHSGASRCSIRAHIAGDDFQLVIQDNGNGIPMELDGRLDRGHGMSTMKSRAKQMQGQCLVESGPGYGTVIRLTLPLDSQGGTAGSPASPG